jgi:hypothetical protein
MLGKLAQEPLRSLVEMMSEFGVSNDASLNDSKMLRAMLSLDDRLPSDVGRRFVRKISV